MSIESPPRIVQPRVVQRRKRAPIGPAINYAVTTVVRSVLSIVFAVVALVGGVATIAMLPTLLVFAAAGVTLLAMQGLVLCFVWELLANRQ